MKLSNLERVHYSKLSKIYKDVNKVDEVPYSAQVFIEELYLKGVHIRAQNSNKPKLKLTFLLFLICVLLLNVVAGIKWVLTGTSYLNEKWWICKWVIAWDKYCGFNIV